MKIANGLSVLMAMTCLAWSTSYSPMKDSVLVESSPIIVSGQVLASKSGISQRAETLYLLKVVEHLKGSTPERIWVRVPGGFTEDGLGLKVFGVPRFQLGDQVLLFLVQAHHGDYAIGQVILGAFHRLDISGKAYGWRHLGEARSVSGHAGDKGEPKGKIRDWPLWLDWIRARANGHHRESEYWVGKPEHWHSEIRSKFVLNEEGGFRLRWNRFDTGGFTTWQAHQDGAEGMSDGGFEAFQNAINIWNGSAQIDYRYGGTSQATAGILIFDGLNTLLFEDPNQELPGQFNCNSGGILAMSGFWFQADVTEDYRGVPHLIILGGDIVTQDGAGCVFGANGNADGEEIFAHELGHTLGLGHSCGDDRSPVCVPGSAFDQALMRNLAHSDGRGAALSLDDRAGIVELYASDLGPGFEVRSRLIYAWVSHNANFDSRVIVNNLESSLVKLFITGKRSDGALFLASRELAANASLNESLLALFPNLEEGNGMTLVIEADRNSIYGSWITFNRNTLTNKSPAKGVAVRLPQTGATPDGRWGKTMLYSFLPITEGFISAPVVVNIGNQTSDVVLEFMSQTGQVIDNPIVIQDLPPFQPFAVTTDSLISVNEDLRMIARSTQPLTGVNFVFNTAGEPAMGNAITILENP